MEYLLLQKSKFRRIDYPIKKGKFHRLDQSYKKSKFHRLHLSYYKKKISLPEPVLQQKSIFILLDLSFNNRVNFVFWICSIIK